METRGQDEPLLLGCGLYFAWWSGRKPPAWQSWGRAFQKEGGRAEPLRQGGAGLPWQQGGSQGGCGVLREGQVVGAGVSVKKDLDSVHSPH